MVDESPKKENFVKEILKFSIIAFLIVVPIRFFVAQPFIVSGASMLPTFESGQYLIVDQLSYNFEKPVRGEVIIFRYPRDTSKFFIKRIIGLPNETLEVKGSQVIITKKGTNEKIFLEEPYLENQYLYENSLKIILDESEYYVLGDNRQASSDSRVWGPLQERLIIGKAFLRLLPITKTSLFPGNYEYER